ncbi:hypothetical protein QZH41_009131, partial [Actinostola sp. cb2023]
MYYITRSKAGQKEWSHQLKTTGFYQSMVLRPTAIAKGRSTAMVVSLFSPFKFSFLFFAVRGYVTTSTATPWVSNKKQLNESLHQTSFLKSCSFAFQSAQPSFDQYVSSQRGRSDTRSLPFLRETQLYSRSSRGHLRILGRKIDAVGKDGDVYAKLIIESDNFGRVKIRGAKSSHYLCVRNKDGRLIGRKVAIS